MPTRYYIAKDGQEALDYIFAVGSYSEREIDDKPKVILLDLKLPKVGGLEIIRKVKSDARTKDIPVVVLTSSKEDRNKTESYKLGINSYIVKPVNFSKFTEAVSELGFYWVLLNEPPY